MKHLFSILLAVCALTATAQLPSYLPTEGLVGWWPFNGNANDESGNGNHGVVNGATLAEDRLGNLDNSYYFAGDVNNKIIIPHSDIFNSNNELTVSIWAYFQESWNYHTESIIYKGGLPFNTGWHIGVNQDDGGYGFDNYSLVGELLGISSANYCCFPFQDFNLWRHYILSFDGTILKIYVDGVLRNSSSISTATTNNNFSINIGGSINPVSGAYNRSIDDIGIWNRALTQQEITALYTGVSTNNNGDTSSANVPQGISYQAVARNAQGQPLSNTGLQVKFTLLTDSLTGTAEYTEVHSLTTNDLGLFTTAFGTGTPLSGTFANINWAAGNKYLKVELDAGAGFVDMGTQQLLSVPYAIQAKKSTLLENNALPVYSGNAAALAGGLLAGQMYRTATGDLKIVY